MANKQLLDCVNEVLKRVKIVDVGNVGPLTSLTNSALQHEIDVAIQVINEGIDELFSMATEEPTDAAESNISMILNQREYALASNMVRLIWPMIDRVNIQYLVEWRGTYENFLLLDPQQNYTGLPIWGMISPITGLLRVDRQPDVTSVGHTYTYEYQKDSALFNQTDVVPFNNAVFRSLVPAWAQLWKRDERGQQEFDRAIYTQAMGRASRYVREELPSRNYSPREQ